MELTNKTQHEMPEDHTLIERNGKFDYSIPTVLLVDDLETRMRNILEYLTTESGLDAEFVMEEIFLDDKAAKLVRRDASDKEYYSIQDDLEDELGL